MWTTKATYPIEKVQRSSQQSFHPLWREGSDLRRAEQPGGPSALLLWRSRRRVSSTLLKFALVLSIPTGHNRNAAECPCQSHTCGRFHVQRHGKDGAGGSRPSALWATLGKRSSVSFRVPGGGGAQFMDNADSVVCGLSAEPLPPPYAIRRSKGRAALPAIPICAMSKGTPARAAQVMVDGQMASMRRPSTVRLGVLLTMASSPAHPKDVEAQ